jgi:hypothetical protein
LAPRVSAALEVTIPGSFAFQSGTARDGAINGTFRDFIFSGLMKVRVVGPLEVGAGVSVVKEDLAATRTPPSFLLNPGLPVPLQNNLGLAPGFIIGADVGLPLSPHVILTPGIRLHLIQRGSLEKVQIGLGSAVIQGGVAVRVVF